MFMKKVLNRDLKNESPKFLKLERVSLEI